MNEMEGVKGAVTEVDDYESGQLIYERERQVNGLWYHSVKLHLVPVQFTLGSTKEKLTEEQKDVLWKTALEHRDKVIEELQRGIVNDQQATD